MQTSCKLGAMNSRVIAPLLKTMNEQTFNELKDDNGQISFAAAVFYDEELHPAEKQHLLIMAADVGDPEIKKEVEYYWDKLNESL